MPKYWGKQIFSHGSFPEVGEKQRALTKEKEKSMWKQWPASLPSANTGSAHKLPSGPIIDPSLELRTKQKFGTNRKKNTQTHCIVYWVTLQLKMDFLKNSRFLKWVFSTVQEDLFHDSALKFVLFCSMWFFLCHLGFKRSIFFVLGKK